MQNTLYLKPPTQGCVVTLKQAHLAAHPLGFAMIPTERVVHAPLSGTVTRLHKGGCIVQGDDGACVAMPLQTPTLTLVRQGEYVHCGQDLLLFAQDLPDFLPVVLTNGKALGYAQVQERRLE